MKIWLDDQLYFHESVALVEFAWCLTKWLNQANGAEKTVPLTYFTMDHDEREGALLTLTPLNDHQYSIDSIWKEFEHTSALVHPEVKAAVEDYLKDLDRKLRAQGGSGLQALLPE